MSKYLCPNCVSKEQCNGEWTTHCVSYVPKEHKQTEQEYLQTCNTEQLAEWIVYAGDQCTKGCEDCVGWCDKDKVIEWLKQPHHESVTNCNE